MTSKSNISGLVDHLFREEAGKMIAVLIRIFGFRHAELVEDIVQDTFLTALKKWRHNQIPDNPSAWLMQVAKNKTLNALKRENRSVPLDQHKSTPELEETIDKLFLEHEIKDSQLRVLFACCDPHFSTKAQIILTLKTLSGFSNSEIARALLMSEAAVKKTLYRTRKSIREDGLEFGVPFLYEIDERLPAVHTAIYLMFNEGYKCSEGNELIKESLCFEAARLTKQLIESLPEQAGQSHALLSLIYFSISRFNARHSENGDIIDLQRQDRRLWNKDLINMGFNHLRKSRQSETLSRYHLEAGINSVHCLASAYEETDWNSIVNYYDRLQELVNDPIVQINRAVAVSNQKDPDAGLKALEQLEQTDFSDRYYLFHATKADMHFRLGNYELARSYYRVAVDLAESKVDIRFLEKKIEECDKKNIMDN
jgi:RNA polymerase sigma-70 factor (ECF subfamily)